MKCQILQNKNIVQIQQKCVSINSKINLKAKQMSTTPHKDEQTQKKIFKRRYRSITQPKQEIKHSISQSIQKQRQGGRNKIIKVVNNIQFNVKPKQQNDNFKFYKQSFQLPNFGINNVENKQFINSNLHQLNDRNGVSQNSLIKKSRLRTLESQPKYFVRYNRNSIFSINSLQKPTIDQQNIKTTLDQHKIKSTLDQKRTKSPYFNNNVQKKSVQSRLSMKKNSFIVQRKDGQKQVMRKNSLLISRNRILLYDPKSSLNLKQQAHCTLRAKKKTRSNSQSQPSINDQNFTKLIKKQLSSLSINEYPQDIVRKNYLDQSYLTQYQKEEIKNYKDVYYIGHKAFLRKFKENFRDNKDNYKTIVGDHIAYRFQILKILGSGAFGKVLQVTDYKQPINKRKRYALKILKKSQDLYEQFKLQIKILKLVKQNSQALKNIVEIKGDFQFRGHLCIVTELLDINIYSYIKSQQYTGMPLQIVRKIIIQVLQALLFLHRKQIIHCDIKPENIVFKEYGKSGVKLIDFGSACFWDRKQFTYIQSRYYRSPEIVLVKPYDEKIDVWSTGCLAYQMFTGSPLFPARNQKEQISMLKQTLGSPPKDFLIKCQRNDQFKFEQGYKPLYPFSKRINKEQSSQAFIDFMQKTIRWSPEQRLTIEQALMHNFILEGLPQKVKSEHLSQMKSKNPYGLCKQ